MESHKTKMILFRKGNNKLKGEQINRVEENLCQLYVKQQITSHKKKITHKQRIQKNYQINELSTDLAEGSQK